MFDCVNGLYKFVDVFHTSSMSSTIAKSVTPSFVLSVSKSFMCSLNSFGDKGLP